MKKQLLLLITALLLSWSAGAQMVLEFNTNLSDGTSITLPLKGTVDGWKFWVQNPKLFQDLITSIN